jgi:hypothetical protein
MSNAYTHIFNASKFEFYSKGLKVAIKNKEEKHFLLKSVMGVDIIITFFSLSMKTDLLK